MTFASVRVANGVWTLKSLSLFTIIEAANRGPTGLVHLNAESLAARVALGLNRLPLCGVYLHAQFVLVVTDRCSVRSRLPLSLSLSSLEEFRYPSVPFREQLLVLSKPDNNNASRLAGTAAFCD